MQFAHLLLAIPKRALALLLLLLTLKGQALTLGRMQGAALIGRPLSMTVAVALDPAQSVGSACFEVDVFYADTRQDPSGVRLQLVSGPDARSLQLRVTSDNPVDEPVVTVYVRTICAPTLSRRYVMLADIASEPAVPAPVAPMVPLVVPSAAPLPGPGPAAATGQAATGQAATGQAATGPAQDAGGATAPTRATPTGVPTARAPAAAPRKARAAPARKRPAGAVAAKSVAPKPAAMSPAAGARNASASDGQPVAGRTTGQSRLRLDPIEVLSERVATLESNTADAPAQVAAREARDAQRLASLETSVKALVALAARNEASLLELRSRLERDRSDRYANVLVYLLLALLLACLVAIAYLLAHGARRGRQGAQDPWWDESAQRHVRAAAAATTPIGPVPGPDSALSVLSEPSPLSQPVTQPPAERAPVQPTQPITQPLTQPMTQAMAGRVMAGPVDVSLVEMSASTFDRMMQSGAAHNAVRVPRDAGAALDQPNLVAQAILAPATRHRRIDLDELIDIRQRAEFFVSLGQTDQAVQVLEARIAQDSASCPQAFLDLLKLFHSLGLKADFQQVKDDFIRIYNVQVPRFADFEDEGATLEDYPGTVDRLIAVWDRSSVIDVIEHLLYRQPDVPSPAPFDLAAFRDLLLLYAVAPAVQGPASAAAPGSVGARGQVDIDLSELFAEPPLAAHAQVVAGGATAMVASGNLIDFDLSEPPSDEKARMH